MPSKSPKMSLSPKSGVQKLIKNNNLKFLKQYSEIYLDKNIQDHRDFYDEIHKAESLPKTETSPEIKPKKSKNSKMNLINIGYSISSSNSDETVLDRAVEKIFGRYPCDCLGQKHELINNCLYCGRIVCEVEGEGPCLTCNKHVSKEDEVINDPEYHEAIKLRDRLLKQQKMKKQSTKVYDDQTDYFSYENVWLAKKLRKEIEKIDKERNVSQYIQIDLQKEQIDVIEMDEYVEKLNKLKDDYQEPIEENIYDLCKENQNFTIPDFTTNDEFIPVDFMGHCDDLNHSNAFCLTIPQPWASLVINGNIKLIPFDDYFDFRGYAWIIATKPEKDFNIDQITTKLGKYWVKNKMKTSLSTFPEQCFIGRVTLTDCQYYQEDDYFTTFNTVSEKSFYLSIETCEYLEPLLPIKISEGFYKIPMLIQNILENIIV